MAPIASPIRAGRLVVSAGSIAPSAHCNAAVERGVAPDGNGDHASLLPLSRTAKRNATP